MTNTSKQHKKIPPVVFNIIIIQAIFVIIIIAVIIKELTKSPSIDNRNNQPAIAISDSLRNDTKLPESYIDDITHSLTAAIELNTPIINLTNTTATVRDNSLSIVEFAEYQFSALSFIADIPELEESYQIYYKYPTSKDENTPYFNNPRAVLCLDDSFEKLYPDFDCRSSYPTDTRERIIADYSHFLTFDNFFITIDSQNPRQINLSPTSNVTDTSNESYISEVKSIVKSLGVSPDLFTYQVGT